MKKTVGAFVCIILLSGAVLLPFASADWTMYGADPSHSNAGTGNPPLSPTILWDYNGGENDIHQSDQFDCSPAVVNGVVYTGADDGNVYALNATNGVVLWNYTTGGVVRSSPQLSMA